MDAPDPDRADAVLDAAEAAAADTLRVGMMRAHLLRARGNLEAAMECARSALTRQPEDVEAIAVTGELLWQQGHYDSAREVLEKLPSDSPRAQGLRARHHARLAVARFELETAEDLIAEAIRLLGSDAELLNLKTRISLMRGVSEEALSSLRERGALLQRAGFAASHPETVGGFNLHLVREYRVNPFAEKSLQDVQTESPAGRIAAIAQILRDEPNHFGTAHQLLVNLRQLDAFAHHSLPAGMARRTSSVIPRKIVQYWDQPEIPADILQGMQTWPQQCLGFEHQVFNDASAHAFIKRNCDKKVAKAYRQANHPAMRADIFRLAYLAVEGGIYADADDICRQSIGTLLSPGRELVVMQEDLGSVGNNFICARPRHPFIEEALEQVVENVIKRQGDIIWFLTGPGAITQRFCLHFLDALAAGGLPSEVQLLDFYVLQRHLSMHLPRAYKRSALHWTSPDAMPMPLFMPG
jgi:tetratricopeptide (TPR) repeat protein